MRLAVGELVLLAATVANAQNELEAIPVIPIAGCGEGGRTLSANNNQACVLDGAVGLHTVLTLPSRFIIVGVSVTLQETKGEQSPARIASHGTVLIMFTSVRKQTECLCGLQTSLLA